MHLEGSIVVDAPADAVWEILAHRFADIGVWASAIPQSDGVGRAAPSCAPGTTRTCQVAAPGFERVTERITEYDEERRCFTYVAAAGMPRMVESASNTWTVNDLDGERCQVRTSAELRLRGATRFAAPLMALVLRRLGRQSLADLKHYAETGQPSAAKARAAQRAVRGTRR